MGRKASVEDEELLARLGAVFRDVGYEGATLAALSDATGLQKASLYHRFPGGKEQMAREVLDSARAWVEAEIAAPLRADGSPAARIGDMVRKLDAFYAGGRQACLLNMLSSTRIHESPFTPLIRGVFEAWIGALAVALVDAGVDRTVARARAERAVGLLQGSLVLSRGMGTTRPFRDALKALLGELLDGVPAGGGRQRRKTKPSSN